MIPLGGVIFPSTGWSEVKSFARAAFLLFLSIASNLSVTLPFKEPAPTGEILIRRRLTVDQARELASKAGKGAIQTTDNWTLVELWAPEPAISPLGSKLASDITYKQWLLAKPPKTLSAPKNRREAWEAVHEQLKRWSTSKEISLQDIDIAEPNLVFQTKGPSEKLGSVNHAWSGNDVHVDEVWSRHWPKSKDFAWHLGSDFTQLRAARNAVRDGGYFSNEVRVILLDTGARADYSIIPEHYNSKEAINLYDDSAPEKWSLHGTSTTAVLAGGSIHGKSDLFKNHDNPEGTFDEYLGGAPLSPVTTYRIHQSVIHIATATMGAGIHAAVNNGADVISISHGGLPSFHWADEVNYAYEHGAAIFAASGDFYNFCGFHTPRWVVFPAAYDRVMAVPGVTFAKRSYGKAHNIWSFFLFSDWSRFFMRGSYGPVFEMNNAVCGFSPNIVWAGSKPDSIDLNGGGTSAATPQVAAAAVLWLQRHRNDGDLSDPCVWRSPKKVNAVYYALRCSAHRDGLTPDPDPLYFGLGTVAAKDALSVPYRSDYPEFQDAGGELLEFLALITDWFGPAAKANIETRSANTLSLFSEAIQIAYWSKPVQKRLEKVRDLNALTESERHKIATEILTDKNASTTLRTEGKLLFRFQNE